LKSGNFNFTSAKVTYKASEDGQVQVICKKIAISFTNHLGVQVVKEVSSKGGKADLVCENLKDVL
jgi:hypothetical protein